MKMQLVGGAVLGAIGTLIVMFSTGWAVTSGSAHATSAQMVGDAIRNNLVPICVAQFEQSANKDAQFKKLKALDEWKRGDYVDANGWATMPGSESPAHDLARECARRIVDL